MRFAVLGGLILLAGCGGGGTTGTNYSDAPPMAEIVGTPVPKPSATPESDAEAEVATNVEEAAPVNEAESDAAVESAASDELDTANDTAP